MKVTRTIGLLLAAALTASFVVAPPASAAARPAFELPFPCGQKWNGATYDDHGDSNGDGVPDIHYPLDLNQGARWDDFGKPVVASASGTAYPREESDGDHVMEIVHGGGWSTEYRHLDEFAVSGGSVRQGQVIGYVGNRGTEWPHLHFEQQYNGNAQHIYLHGSPITYSFDYNGPLYTSHNCGSTPAPEFGLAGGPAVVFGTSLQYYAVGYSANVDLYSIMYQPGAGWSDWAPHDGNIRGKPSVVKYGDTLQIYVRGTDNHLYQKYWSPRTSWSGWIDRGGSLASNPVAIVHNDNLHVFARNGSGNLIHRAYDGGTGGQGWLDWSNRRGVFVGNPAVVNYGTSIQIYVRSPGNNLYSIYWSPNSSWSNWSNRGGPIASDPVAVVYQGNIHIFARDTDRSLVHLAYDGGTGGQGWLRWHDLDGGFVGKPGVVTYGTSLQIYVRSIGDNLYSMYWSPSSGWSNWSNHDGSVTSDPVTLVYQGNLHIFARTSTGHLSHLAYDGGTGGTGWLDWRDLGGRIY